MSRNAWQTAPLVALATLIVQGCQDPARPATPGPLMAVATQPAPLVPRLIAPQVTDPDIDWVPTFNPQFNHHFVWLDESRPANGKLFVFVAGAGPNSPRPRCCQLVQQEAARLGYHVIGLIYPSNIGVGGCFGGGDPECFEDVRMEILDGVDRSAFVDVSDANSIDNRLTKVLLYLEAQFPTEGWSKFLHEGAPKWSQIAVGGHSSGAAQAALIGKIRHVDRVVMLGGPAADGPPEATWASIGETPVAKYFALVHVRDHFGTAIFANIAAFDLERFGDPVQVELAEPPYDGTHILNTDLAPQGGFGTINNPHLSSAFDVQTPLGADGTPLLRDAWRYMLRDHETSGRW